MPYAQAKKELPPILHLLLDEMNAEHRRVLGVDLESDTHSILWMLRGHVASRITPRGMMSDHVDIFRLMQEKIDSLLDAK